MKKYFFIFSAILVGVAFAWREQTHWLGRFERAQKSTVLLESSKSFGSGVIIRKTNPNDCPRLFVWTAAHVVRADNTVKVSQVIRLDGRKAGTINFSAHVLVRDSSLDLALLWLEAPANFFSASAFDGTKILPVGTGVFHCGNFSGPKLEGSFSSGVVSQVGVSSPEFPWQIIDQASAVVQHGCSGGGLFSDRSGKLVGIVTGLFDSGVTFFVPARAVNTFCVVHNVQWAFSGDACPSDGKLLLLQESAKLSPQAKAPDAFLQLLLAP